MKSRIEAGELMLRIRREARRLEDLAFAPAESPDEVQVNDALPMPRAPVLRSSQPVGFSCESLLAQAGNMIESARMKTTVARSIPRLLRRLWRNQGGYNDIVVEALTRLHEANRLLMSENGLMRLHIQRQTEWMQAADRRFAQLEKRLEQIEPQTGSPGEAPDR